MLPTAKRGEAEKNQINSFLHGRLCMCVNAPGTCFGTSIGRTSAFDDVSQVQGFQKPMPGSKDAGIPYEDAKKRKRQRQKKTKKGNPLHGPLKKQTPQHLPSLIPPSGRVPQSGAGMENRSDLLTPYEPLSSLTMGGLNGPSNRSAFNGRGQAAEVKLQKMVDTMLFQSWRGLPWQARICPQAHEEREASRLYAAMVIEKSRVMEWRNREKQRALDAARAEEIRSSEMALREKERKKQRLRAEQERTGSYESARYDRTQDRWQEYAQKGIIWRAQSRAELRVLIREEMDRARNSERRALCAADLFQPSAEFIAEELVKASAAAEEERRRALHLEQRLATAAWLHICGARVEARVSGMIEVSNLLSERGL